MTEYRKIVEQFAQDIVASGLKAGVPWQDIFAEFFPSFKNHVAEECESLIESGFRG